MNNCGLGAVMVSEIVSQADSAFQQGDFELASRLYAEALGSLEQAEGSAKDLALVLNKLADSEYALNRYDQARHSYERLVGVQESLGSSNKERVLALLKLAKSSDKSALPEQAESSFQSAYELSKSSLSAKHFLQRTVRQDYAYWLRETGRNMVLLALLEDELGIRKTSDEPSPASESPEAAQDSATVADTAPATREHEYFVMKTKLTRKSTRDSSAKDIEPKKTKKAQGQTKPTIEQQVAERKFLRKGDEKGDADQRSNRRAKLRSALSGDRATKSGETAAPSEDALSHIVPAEPGDQPAAQLQQLEKTPVVDHDDQHVDAALAKFAGMKPRRFVSDQREIAARKKKGVDLIVPTTQALPTVPESSRNFFQHAEAVKKADGTAQEAPDLVQLRAEAPITPVLAPSARVAALVRVGSPIAAVVLLVFAVVTLSSRLKTSQDTGIPTFAIPLMGHNFVSADDALSVAVDRSATTVSGIGLSMHARTRFWKGDWRDELSFLQGGFKSCRWLIAVPEGLKDEGGVTFYSLEAPERKVLAFMKVVAEDAQQFYNNNGDYPSYARDFDSQHNAYPNPFSGKPEMLAVFSGVNSEKVESDRAGQLDAELKNGAPFNNERSSNPGAVHAYSVIGQPQYERDLNAYNWKVHCFYIRGYDRDARVIGSSVKNQAFVLTLKNGASVTNNAPPADYGSPTRDICLSQTPPPNADLIVFKYVLSALAAGLFCLAVLSWRGGLFSLRRSGKVGSIFN